MAYLLKKDKRIIADIEEALSYYDAISSELGEKFESALLNALSKIEKHPHYYFNINQKFRRINLENFPYKLLYVLIEDLKEVIVLGLFHHLKKPEEIRKRSR